MIIAGMAVAGRRKASVGVAIAREEASRKGVLRFAEANGLPWEDSRGPEVE